MTSGTVLSQSRAVLLSLDQIREKQLSLLIVLCSCGLSDHAHSHVGCGVCGGEVLHAEANHFTLRCRWTQEVAGEDLAAGLAEVLGQESIEDGVNAGVSVGQTVGHDTKGEGGVIQREGAKLRPHGDDVMRHPAYGEGSDDQENNLSRLQGNPRGNTH